MSGVGQAETFLITIFTGGLLGLLFDCYRIWRGVIRPHWLITSLTDLLYWLLATVVVFAALLLGNWGEIRVYEFVGLLLGVVLYYRLLSRTVIRCLIAVMRGLAKLLRAVWWVVYQGLCRPLLILWHLAGIPFRLLRVRRKREDEAPDGGQPPDKI